MIKHFDNLKFKINLNLIYFIINNVDLSFNKKSYTKIAILRNAKAIVALNTLMLKVTLI